MGTTEVRNSLTHWLPFRGPLIIWVFSHGKWLPNGEKVRSKDFLEAGILRLPFDTARKANTHQVSGLERESQDLKPGVVKLYLRNDWPKNSLSGQGDPRPLS